MSKYFNQKNRTFQIFAILLGITIIVWLLRGFGVLTFIPGGILWLLILLCTATAIMLQLQRTWWRY